MWSLDGNTVQITIKTLGLPRICFTVLFGWFGGFWVYLGCCFLGSFCGLRCFFLICKILLQFVHYKYMCPRLSLPDSCSSLSTCKISKSTYCSCPSGHLGSQLAQASLRALLFSYSAEFTAYPISFFPLSFWNERQGLAALYLGQWYCY